MKNREVLNTGLDIIEPTMITWIIQDYTQYVTFNLFYCQAVKIRIEQQ